MRSAQRSRSGHDPARGPSSTWRFLLSDPIRVLIADDHAVVRRGLRLFLELQEDVSVVGEAGTGDQAIRLSIEEQPDVVLMDLDMPEMDGVQATRALRASADAKVLVLTSFADDEHVLAALQAGAAGYLLKDAAPASVLDAVRAVSRGEPVIGSEPLRSLVHGLGRGVAAPPEGTITILFTDIERSTELFQRLGDERARALLREHDTILCDAFDRHDGTQVKRQGDGMMAVFSSARRALRAAIEIQQGLAERNRAHPDTELRVRIGINTGEAIAEDDDYFGAAVVVAARIAGKARGGEILASEVTKALIGPNRVAWSERGEVRLKGLDDAYRLYEAVWNE
jgi:class 3 adenylate cyclase